MPETAHEPPETRRGKEGFPERFQRSMALLLAFGTGRQIISVLSHSVLGTRKLIQYMSILLVIANIFGNNPNIHP